MFKRVLCYVDRIFNKTVILKIIAFLTILALLMVTVDVWGAWFNVAKSIMLPFIIGFVLAYVINPLVIFLERKGIPKNFTIIVFWIILIIVFALLLIYLLPVIYGKITDFIASMINGVQWVSDKIVDYGEFENLDLVDNITNTLVGMLQSYNKWVPGIVSSIPGFMNSFLNIITNTLFSVIIAIYMLFDFDKIKQGICKFLDLFSVQNRKYMHVIDEDVGVYLKSLLILMVIKFFEYSLLYILIGHQDWMIVAILTSIGLWIPYLGGTIANVIGILTALSLSPIRIICLLIGICVLSNVDAYVIQPLVHEKRSSLGPLVTLFSVFAGGVIYGAIGVMISVPLAIAIKSIHQVYVEEDKNLST